MDECVSDNRKGLRDSTVFVAFCVLNSIAMCPTFDLDLTKEAFQDQRETNKKKIQIKKNTELHVPHEGELVLNAREKGELLTEQLFSHEVYAQICGMVTLQYHFFQNPRYYLIQQMQPRGMF